jgi:hypothetical protein
MQYICLIYGDEQSFEGMGDEDRNQVMADYMAFTESIGKSGNLVAGDALQPTTTATTVRVRNGETLVTDGPFADTKEAFAGFYLLEADDLDAALAIAGKVPAVRLGGSVEVRPLREGRRN